jgi:hypothetical protein
VILDFGAGLESGIIFRSVANPLPRCGIYFCFGDHEEVFSKPGTPNALTQGDHVSSLLERH